MLAKKWRSRKKAHIQKFEQKQLNSIFNVVVVECRPVEHPERVLDILELFYTRGREISSKRSRGVLNNVSYRSLTSEGSRR